MVDDICLVDHPLVDVNTNLGADVRRVGWG